MHQKICIDKHKYLSETANYLDYRLIRAKLPWALSTRPYIYCSIAKRSQVTEEEFDNDNMSLIWKVNNIFSHLQNNAHFTQKCLKLDKTSPLVQIYSNASFASSFNLSPQLEYFIF